MRTICSLLLAAAVLPAADNGLDASIERLRMGVLVVKTAPGAKVSVEQVRHEFWFGATLPNGIFSGRSKPEDAARFKEVFTSLFNSAVTENAVKWPDMEPERGRVNFSVVDNMLAWTGQEGIPLRGHNIYWGIPNRVQEWLKPLPDAELRLVLQARARTLAARYRGRMAEYDLNNEMIHGNYYEQRFGPRITLEMAQWFREVDPEARLWLNDYDILTGRRLADYVKHIRGLLDMGVPIAGIGVQGHLHGDSFDPEALRNALDELAQFKLPLRVTEFNFPGQRSKFYTGDRKAQMTPEEEQAKAAAITEYYRICFAHPAVAGILMWGFWEGANWIPQSSLYRRDWTPTPAAEAYKDLVLNRWWTRWSGTAGADGMVVLRAFYGKHRVTVNGRETTVDLRQAAGVAVVEAP